MSIFKDSFSTENRPHGLPNQSSENGEKASSSTLESSAYIALITNNESDKPDSHHNPYGLSLIASSSTNTRITDGSGREIWRHPNGKPIAGMDLSRNGTRAMLSFYTDSDSPSFEIYRLPMFELTARLEKTEFNRSITWRWLNDKQLVGHKNSSGGDQQLRSDEKSAIYVFDIDSGKISSSIRIPDGIPPLFELSSTGTDSLLKLEAITPDGSQVITYITIEPAEGK